MMLYIKDGQLVIILIYVDDILMIENNTSLMKDFILKLNIVFSLIDLGKLHYFLSIETIRIKDFLHPNQNKYIL